MPPLKLKLLRLMVLHAVMSFFWYATHKTIVCQKKEEYVYQNYNFEFFHLSEVIRICFQHL